MRFFETTLLLAVALAACQNRVPGGPIPLAITPAQAGQGQAVAVTITGQDFWPEVSANFQSSGSSKLDTTFEVRLGQVSLQRVMLQSDFSLTATTLPLAPGFYDLTVVSPSGKAGVLPKAFEVMASLGCDGGDCQVVCGMFQTACPTDGGTNCADLQTDSSNCGGCGVSCPASESCIAGDCTCPSALAACTTDAGPVCTDLQTDADHCGACDVLCPAAQACDAGHCSCPGDAPSYCPADAGYCANLQTDLHNCGVCGNACFVGEACTGGSCACPIADPNACPSDAGLICTDTQTDLNNCGGCGVLCFAGQSCGGGQCTCPTATPTACSGTVGPYCADTQSDPANCGVCGNACGPGLDCCTGSCVDTLVDANNCGGCGNACAASTYCGGDAGCLALPAECATATPLDGDGRWIGADAGRCAAASNGFIENDAGADVDCSGDGVCIADVGLDGGWYRFVGGHTQLFTNDAGTVSPYHCGTEEPGWLQDPVGPTPLGISTPGNVCFADFASQCDYTALVHILNCGDAGYVYQLPNFTGVCVYPTPYIVNLGGYCTQ